MYFAYGAITLWGAASQQLLLYRRLITLRVQVRRSHLTTPYFARYRPASFVGHSPSF